MRISARQRRARVPVSDFKRILVALDFSDPSRQSLQQAIRLARPLGSKLRLIYVVESAPFFSGANTDPLMVVPDDKLILLAKTKLEDMAQVEVSDELEVSTKVASGRSHREIVEEAKRWPADLIVMGTHGHTGLKRHFLGSTAESVVRYAPCPVLVMRTAKERGTGRLR